MQTRLFPHGVVILLTNALILENPIAAEKIIGWFDKMRKQRTPGTWKLVGRPGFKDWVLSVANERGDGDGLRSETFQAYVVDLTPAISSTYVLLSMDTSMQWMGVD